MSGPCGSPDARRAAIDPAAGIYYYLHPDCCIVYMRLVTFIYMGWPGVCNTCVHFLAFFIDSSEFLATRYTLV